MLLGRDAEEISPVVLFFVYHICGAHMPSGRKTSQSSKVVQSLRDTFLTINSRWNQLGTSYSLRSFL